MEIRDIYLNKLIRAKDTEFIKVVTGLRRSGKSNLMKMYMEYLFSNGIKKENIIYINFESGIFDYIKTYKELYMYVSDRICDGKNYILLDEIQNVEIWEKAVNALNIDFDVDIYITRI